MDLLLELSMCVWFKLIYFAIGTLSVFMVEFVSLYYYYFLGFVALWYCFFYVLGSHYVWWIPKRIGAELSYLIYLYLQSTLKSIFITYVAAWHHLIVFVLIVTFVLTRGYFFMLMLVGKAKQWEFFCSNGQQFQMGSHF